MAPFVRWVLTKLIVFVVFAFCSEDLYGAVLEALVSDDRQDEAEALVRSMEAGEDGIHISPGTLSFDALVMGHIQKKNWQAVVDTYETVKERDIAMGPQMMEGLVVAHQHIGGKDGVVFVVEELLHNDRAKIQDALFRQIAQILFEDMDLDSFDTFRQQVRAEGEKDRRLRDSSLQVVRSLRVAEIEADRPSSRHKSEADLEAVRDQAWKDATKYLLDFFRALTKE